MGVVDGALTLAEKMAPPGVSLKMAPKMGTPVHTPVHYGIEDKLGWVLAAAVVLYYLHRAPEPVPEVPTVEGAPTNVSEVDPGRWPSGEQPLAAVVPNADPIPDPVVQDVHDKVTADEPPDDGGIPHQYDDDGNITCFWWSPRMGKCLDA